METPKEFKPIFKNCGKTPILYAGSSVQSPMGGGGKTHLLLRNVSQFYSSHSVATWGPYRPAGCVENGCLGGGLACLMFDLQDNSCYRAIFKVKRLTDDVKKPIKVWFHVHEKGTITHQEDNSNPAYSLLIVDLGYLPAEGGHWQLCLNIATGHSENVFAFYEASIEKFV